MWHLRLYIVTNTTWDFVSLRVQKKGTLGKIIFKSCLAKNTLCVLFDGMLNFKTHFMVWYCVWYEHCNGLFNIRNLVSSLILMFVRICLCDTILYTWFGKKWKRLKKFWGWKICLICAYFFKHLSWNMLVSFILIKKECRVISISK